MSRSTHTQRFLFSLLFAVCVSVWNVTLAAYVDMFCGGKGTFHMRSQLKKSKNIFRYTHTHTPPEQVSILYKLRFQIQRKTSSERTD